MTAHRPSVANTIQTLRIVYATTALCGAMGFCLMGTILVKAETVENATRWMNARESKETQLDIHLQATDKSLEEIRTELGRVIGFGLGISATLGILQIKLGFVAEKK